MPPPTPTSTSPARIAWSSSPTARMPEAQTLLIVSEETSFGMPALIWAWREGIWPWPGLQHLAHDDVLDLLGRDVGALERGLDRDAAELGGVERRQAAAELADRACGRCRGSRSWASRTLRVRRGLRELAHASQAHSIAGYVAAVRPTTKRRRRDRGRHGRRRRVRRRGASPTTSTAARCRRCVDARRGAGTKLRTSPSPTPPASAGARRRARRARRASTPSARGSPRGRGARRARASSARASLCWELPHHVGRRRRRRHRRGHAAGRLPLRPLQARGATSDRGSSS